VIAVGGATEGASGPGQIDQRAAFLQIQERKGDRDVRRARCAWPDLSTERSHFSRQTRDPFVARPLNSVYAPSGTTQRSFCVKCGKIFPARMTVAGCVGTLRGPEDRPASHPDDPQIQRRSVLPCCGRSEIQVIFCRLGSYPERRHRIHYSQAFQYNARFGTAVSEWSMHTQRSPADEIDGRVW